MANLSDLRTRIKNSLAIQGTLYDDLIDDSIRSAIRSYEQKPYWFLQQIDTITLADGSDYVALPTDFASPKEARLLLNNVYRSRIDGFDLVDFDTLQLEYKTVTRTGYPMAYSYYMQRLYVDCTANDDYTIQLTYFKKDETLPQDDADESVWFDDGYDAVRTLAMAIFKDECQEYESTAQDWARAEKYLSDLAERNTFYTLGGSNALN